MIKNLLKATLLTLAITTIATPVFADNIANYKVVYTEGKINGKDKTMGNVNYKDKIITTKTNAKDTPQHILLHEQAHILDRYFDEILGEESSGKYSYEEDFMQVFEEEANKSGLRDYYTEEDSEDEYFAECYAIYKENPAYLKENCPKTYNFMQKNFK